MPVAQECVDFVAGWEGWRPDWYRDVGGVWTIGYGFTERGGRVERGVTETPMEKSRGLALLRDVLTEDVAPGVRRALDVTFDHDPKYWALFSFSFNLGVGAFAGSTMCDLLNAGDEESAEEELMKWVHVDGEVIDGLVNRRKAEKELFERDEPPADPLVEVGPPVDPVRVAEPERLTDDTIDVPNELAPV